MYEEIRVAIVDDVLKDCNQIKLMLNEYVSEQGHSWKSIDCFSNGKEFLEQLTRQKYHLVFMDVLMEDANGIETAQYARSISPDLLLVFISTEAGYAVDGYELEASGFLVKNKTVYKKQFLRLMKRLEKKWLPGPILELSQDNLLLRIPYSAILYVEIRNHCLTVHTEKKCYSLRMAMAEFQPLLADDASFIECHRGILINLGQIKTLGDQTVTMKDNAVLPVSRRKRPELRHAYAAYHISGAREDF